MNVLMCVLLSCNSCIRKAPLALVTELYAVLGHYKIHIHAVKPSGQFYPTLN